MAKSIGVWGIDIGQCGLKTLRCHLEGDTVVADAFDYIEYPKILSQPESNPVELIKEALEQFLSRNNVRGDRVAVSVPGQSGLARYFKPPPVDAKKIADIVKYEARQQIPFPLEDVIWDYQRMGGGTEVDGIALETEVGLFAMKRDQVYKALQPFTNAGIEVDIIQLAPLSIYNYVVFDLLEKTLPPPEQFDPDSPPPSTVVISMGTDTTDLVVTNGYRVWQRNIPLGGNHFTKQLSKELKLTFAKAEHTKRNAHQAEDPKVVFQAMRPVFNDMVTELQRSLGYFQQLDRKAEIANVVVLGNTVKLPGLKQYLTKHLGYNVIDFEGFERLNGETVTKAPAFKDNLLAFGTCYGLCLQGLEKGRLGTNLLPQEIKTERLIRAKKPWAVAVATTFLVACAVNYMFHYFAWNQVHPDAWKDSIGIVTTVSSNSSKLKSDDDAKLKELERLTKIGNEVVGSADRRVLWLELLKAINDSLPQTPGRKPGEVLDPSKVPFSKQKELHITEIESEYFPELKTWFEGQNGAVKSAYEKVITAQAIPTSAVPAAVPGAPANGATVPPGAAAPANGTAPAPGAPPANGPAPAPAAPTAPAAPVVPTTPTSATTATAATTSDSSATGTTTTTAVEGPSGPGWVIELKGYHFYNDDARTAGANHVRQTLVKNLLDGKVRLPLGPGQQDDFTMKELGIGYPIFALNSDLQRNFQIPNPYYQGSTTGETGASGFGSAPGLPMGMKVTTKTKDKTKDKAKDDNSDIPYWEATRYEFIIQFVWQEKPLKERLEARKKLVEAAAQAAGNGEAIAGDGASGDAAVPAAGNTPPAAAEVPMEEAAAPGEAAVAPEVPGAPAAPMPVPEPAPAPPEPEAVPADAEAPPPAKGVPAVQPPAAGLPDPADLPDPAATEEAPAEGEM